MSVQTHVKEKVNRKRRVGGVVQPFDQRKYAGVHRDANLFLKCLTTFSGRQAAVLLHFFHLGQGKKDPVAQTEIKIGIVVKNLQNGSLCIIPVGLGGGPVLHQDVTAGPDRAMSHGVHCWLRHLAAARLDQQHGHDQDETQHHRKIGHRVPTVPTIIS